MLGQFQAGALLEDGSAVADPHISGPHGQHFDFVGQHNAVYSFFSSASFALNAKMNKQRHMPAHTIKKVALVVGHHHVVFDTFTYHEKQAQFNWINRQLKPLGAHVTVLQRWHSVRLCPTFVTACGACWYRSEALYEQLSRGRHTERR